GQVGRQEVGRELDATERQVEGACEGPHGAGLGQSGHAFDQDMSTRDQCDDQPLEQGPLADDRPLEPVDQAARGAFGVWPGIAVDQAKGTSGPTRTTNGRSWVIRRGGVAVPSSSARCRWPRRSNPCTTAWMG